MWSYKVTGDNNPPYKGVSYFESKTSKGAFDLYASLRASLGIDIKEDKVYMWRRKIKGSPVTIVLTEWESCYPFGVKTREYEKDCQIDFNTCNFTIPEILQGS